jgi:hypothetical protein
LKLVRSHSPPGQPHQIARRLDVGYVAGTARREIEDMATLAAAQVEDAVGGLGARALNEQIEMNKSNSWQVFWAISTTSPSIRR